VGLSYSGVHADYSTNDTATASDSNAFLRGFFRRYPHLAGNDFYISGGAQPWPLCGYLVAQASR
jgi:serine carboxypeptidase-like clade 1